MAFHTYEVNPFKYVALLDGFLPTLKQLAYHGKLKRIKMVNISDDFTTIFSKFFAFV